MNLYIKQKLFSWGDKFSVYDRDGNEKYFVKGEVFSLGKRLHVFNTAGNEVCYIQQKIFTFLPKFVIYVNGSEAATITKEFALFRHVYSVDGPGWSIEGDIFEHDYTITCGENVIASVAKKWFTLGDAFEIDISYPNDELTALATVLVIDACIDSSNNNN